MVWRCHAGIDTANRQSDLAWSFLEPWLARAQAFVFSRFSVLPDQLYHGRCLVQPPSIDPFSPKNQDLDAPTVQAILRCIGVLDDGDRRDACALNLKDGTRIHIRRRAESLREGPPPTVDTPSVLDAFAGALRQVLANAPLARRLGESGRRRVARNYLGSNILARYADLVERLDLAPSAA